MHPPEDPAVGALHEAQELAHLLVQQDVLRLRQALQGGLHDQLVDNNRLNYVFM